VSLARGPPGHGRTGGTDGVDTALEHDDRGVN
jgi:hypothetical protein